MKNFFRTLLLLWKTKRVVLKKISKKLVKYNSFSSFFEAYHYIPDDLIMNEPSILNLAPGSTIGPGNKILLSHIPGLRIDKPSLISLGHGCWTGKNVELHVLSGNQILIKDYSTVQDNCKILGDVTIEKYCLLSPSVFISSGRHYAIQGNPDLIRNQDDMHLRDPVLVNKHSLPVHIEEDCWLGFSSFIQQGVYIGRGAIIGANAVVTKDVLPYTVIGGVNQSIQRRFPFDPPSKIEANNPAHKPYFYRGFSQRDGEIKTEIEKGYIVTAGDASFCVLKKGEPGAIGIVGKIFSDIQPGKIEVEICLNEDLVANAIVKPNEGNEYKIELSASDFKRKEDKMTDSAFRLSKEYNIYRLCFRTNTTSEVGLKNGIRGIEQKINY